MKQHLLEIKGSTLFDKHGRAQHSAEPGTGYLSAETPPGRHSPGAGGAAFLSASQCPEQTVIRIRSQNPQQRHIRLVSSPFCREVPMKASSLDRLFKP